MFIFIFTTVFLIIFGTLCGIAYLKMVLFKRCSTTSSQNIRPAQYNQNETEHFKTPTEQERVFHIPRLHVIQCEHCCAMAQSTSASGFHNTVCSAEQCNNCNVVSQQNVHIDMPPSYFETMNHQTDKNHIKLDSRF